MKERINRFAIRANYWLKRYREVVWLIGCGRSGTTWASSLINHDRHYREMFEPFHPYLVESMQFLEPHQYLGPADRNERLLAAAAEVFSGKFSHPRTDTENHSLFYRGLLVKDIFANLFAFWLAQQFPHIKIVLLIRNPFAVALSVNSKRDWLWLDDPISLLKQTRLRDDYLEPFEELIRKTSERQDYLVSQILIWSILNYIPLHQFAQGHVLVSFYEDVLLNPTEEIAKIRQYVNPERSGTLVELQKDVIERPSRVTEHRDFSRQTGPDLRWKTELTPRQIDCGFEILDLFGFADLYNENGMPNHRPIHRLLDGSKDP